MTINAQDSIQAISKYLAFLSDVTQMLNAIGDFSPNKYAETALIDMFDIIYDGTFQSLEKTDKNSPSIDLISETTKMGIQITSDGKMSKIKDCIEKYFKHQIYKKVDKLLIFVITPRQQQYSQAIVDKHLAQVKKRYQIKKRFAFNCTRQVIDKPLLLSQLDLTNVHKLKQIEIALKKQFDGIVVKDKLEGYYGRLRERYFEVAMNDSKGMTLADIYVEPSFSIHKDNVENREAFETSIRDFWNLKSKPFVNEYFNRYLSDGSFSQDITKSNLVLLLGYPGQGKTSFCTKLVADYIGRKTLEDRDIFYFKLKDIPNSKELINSPLSVLYSEIKVITKVNIPNETFRNSILVLDGLDELFMKDGLRLDDIEVLCKELIRETQREEHKNLQIIITSRIGYVDLERLHLSELVVLQLAPLSEMQQIDWVAKYRRFHPATWISQEKVKSYHKSKAFKYSYLKELLEQPLLLHMIAGLKNQIIEANNKSQVYDKLFTELIERKYSTDGQIQILKNIKQGDLRKIVREIAFNIHQTGNGYITKKALLQNDTIKRFLDKLPHEDFKQSLKGIMVAFYFQERSKALDKDHEEEKEFVIEFIHKTLEEYMVAERIVSELRQKLLSKDGEGEYTIDNYYDILNKLNELFSRTTSSEIRSYMTDIIDNIDPAVQNELARRLECFFEDFVKHDFIASYNSKMHSGPLLLSFSTFNCTWLLLRTLTPSKNYLTNKITRQKVVDYLSQFGNIYPSLAFTDCSYQCLSETTIMGSRYFGGHFTENVDFTKTDIDHICFVDSEISNCNFNESDLFDIGLYDVKLVNCNFTDSSLSNFDCQSVTFDNVNFSNCYLDDFRMIDVNFRRMKMRNFDGIILDIETLIVFLKNKAKINLKRINVMKNLRSYTRQYYSYEELTIKLLKLYPGYIPKSRKITNSMTN